MEEGWVEFDAIIATSHRVEKYGGVQLADPALLQIVDALNSGQLPMIGNHDWTKPIRTRDIEAFLVTLADGERAVRLSGLAVQEDWDAVGTIGGVSFSASEPIGRAEGLHPDAEPLKVLADAAWFDDQSIGDACSIMSELAPVEGGRLLQFSAVDDARVVLEMGYGVVLTCGPGLATSAVWDGIKYLLSRRKRTNDGVVSPTRIELVTDLDAGTVVGIIDTADADVAARALATYSAAVTAAAEARAQGKHVVVWEDGHPNGSWVAPS